VQLLCHFPWLTGTLHADSQPAVTRIDTDDFPPHHHSVRVRKRIAASPGLY
jgi:hypothetical protein